MLTLTASLVVCVLAGGVVSAPATAPRDLSPQQPYCGVYCLYAAAVDQGAEVDFHQLLQRKYIGCPLGSSIAELKQAALDFGLNATAFGIHKDASPVRARALPTFDAAHA